MMVVSLYGTLQLCLPTHRYIGYICMFLYPRTLLMKSVTFADMNA